MDVLDFARPPPVREPQSSHLKDSMVSRSSLDRRPCESLPVLSTSESPSTSTGYRILARYRNVLSRMILEGSFSTPPVRSPRRATECSNAESLEQLICVYSRSGSTPPRPHLSTPYQYGSRGCDIDSFCIHRGALYEPGSGKRTGRTGLRLVEPSLCLPGRPFNAE